MVKSEIEKGHVYYFEPNDINTGVDQQGGSVALTPHYEDMCIAMSLTADIYSRKKGKILSLKEQKDGVMVQKRIGWICYNDEGSATPTELVSAGTQMEGDRFLTTYYTEISADKYIENEIVEGLGITSVNVSFESWFTPTITITFVDVNGSSLWGREEAIHDNGRITSSNVLGVFFMQPYPLFRLQIKGFLGQAVTYQLSVSSFKGRYNSQTGNFEATVTFIGYTYSLLSDIPIHLLGSIPETEYVAKQYWDEHITSTEWELRSPDGSKNQPIPLFVLIENIRSAIGSMNAIKQKDCNNISIRTTGVDADGAVCNAVEKDQIVSLQSASIVNDVLTANAGLSNIKTTLDKFVKACKDYCKQTGGAVYIGDAPEFDTNGKKKKQMLMAFGSDIKKRTLEIPPSISNAYKSFFNAVEKFNKETKGKRFNNCLKGTDLDKAVMQSTTKELNLTQIFKLSYKFGDFTNTTATIADKSNISDLWVTYAKLYPSVASQLEEIYNAFNGGAGVGVIACTNLGEYAYMLPLGYMYSDISQGLGDIGNIAHNIETTVENQIMAQANGTQTVSVTSDISEQDEVVEKTAKRKIMEIIGFEPTIGNFVKLVMCHLETFVEVMFTCAENIYRDTSSGLRKPKKLGVNIEDTDIPIGTTVSRNTETNDNNTDVCPWPALYNPDYDENNSESKSNQSNNKYEAFGWPQDYQKNGETEWEESKVVLSFIDSISRCKEYILSQNKGTISTEFSSIPISGLDLSKINSPFSGVGETWMDIGNLSAYLGLRVAQVIGVGDSKCDSEIAEAIGSIDALNLMYTTSKHKELREAVTPKDGKQTFINRVIDYITCSNKADSTNGTERGNTFNSFEFIPDGSYYSGNKRHPIFVEQGDSYVYSYTYTNRNGGNGVISIVPTEIKRFDGQKNPYANDLILHKSSEDSKYTFIPNINKNGQQKWVYTCESEAIPYIGYNNEYFNNRLFTVIEGANIVKSLIREIEQLKEGKLNIRGISVKGSDEDSKIKKFIDRKYQISDNDYTKFYFGEKNYHMIAPPLETIDEDYVKEHLCYGTETKSQVKYDGQWCYNTDSKLYKKLTLQRDGSNFAFKNEDKTFDNTELNVVDLPIMYNGNIGSLFGSHLYYLQNDIGDEHLRHRAKSYLILSSLMSGLDEPEKSLFKTDGKSVIKRFPPFYILFLGALLWRKSLPEGQDINFGEIQTIPDKNTSLISRGNKILCIDSTQNKDWYVLQDYYTSFDFIDISVKNKLINLFINYTGSVMGDIIRHCELQTYDNRPINGEVWSQISQVWSSNEFDASSAEKWAGIFGNTFNIYCSMALPNGKQSIKLLFNEKNNVIQKLNFLYGINNSFIVSRATSNRIGYGDYEVKVTKSQMKSYLKGFEERLKAINDEAKNDDKNTKGRSNTTTVRDTAISLYYSFKHIWDTWLISAARDQFTIKEFFNKYFIFMDSFYVNTYDKIKLNAEFIEKAYSGNEKQSLLSFITEVTSKEDCMFFALPYFIDTNKDVTTIGEYNSKNNPRNGDFTWKRDELKQMFTPVPYNDINPPEPNNTFVFIYTHPFSDTALENTGKKFDSYMMNDDTEWPSVLKETVTGADRRYNENDETPQNMLPSNRLSNSTEELVSGRFGYMMPCFGVTVNRGNNYIFKSINVNMDSPKITAIAAQTYGDILTKVGADGSKRIFFRGQDIYSIYSQYAYACEIEMMGCAQLQPLMYFQLLNIPMWRGTYMIYKVTHSMSPGKMTTKFTGMKMSRKQAPYADGYFVVGKASSQGGITVNGGNGNGDGDLSTGAYYEGQGAVGGVRMIKAIFGNNFDKAGYSKTGDDYDVYRGVTKKGNKHWHCGVDISGPEGTPLYAPWDGYVKIAKLNSGIAGNYLMFADNNDRVAVVYMHCQKLNVQKGDKVKAGAILSYLGRTGSNAVSGKMGSAHLHLELYINGKLTMGESTRHGGKGEHVNPLGEYGGIPVSSQSNGNSNSGNSNSASWGLLKTNAHANNNYGVVGDSWSEGLKTYFKYQVGEHGQHLDFILNEYVPKICKTNCNIVVIACGLNDYSRRDDWLKSKYVDIGKYIHKAGKTCYICKFPKLKEPYDTGRNKLNSLIDKGASDGKYTPIDIPDTVSRGNISLDGFHLVKWGEMYNVIKNVIG